MVENKELIRAFIAIEFSDEVIKEIARVQEEVGKMRFNGKLTELENLHLTLKFLGEIDEIKLDEVKKKLKDIKFNELDLKLGQIGMFNVRENPRIVWIKVEGEEIWELQKRIDSALIGLFKPEERFMSHLTIARIKYAENPEEFIKRVKKLGVKEIKFKIK
jgi:2'-5' RNA ligase